MITASMLERDTQVRGGLADLYLDLDIRGVSMLDFDDPAGVAVRGYDAAMPQVEAWAAHVESGPGTRLRRAAAPGRQFGVFRDSVARAISVGYSRHSIARGDYACVGDSEAAIIQAPEYGQMGGIKMASARSVLDRLKSSDGRIRIKTLSGVWLLVAVIALLVGVLPVFASHSESLVKPVVVNLGGGSGHCSSTTDDGRLPSAAGNEFHINNPTSGTHNLEDANGNEITVVVEGPNDNRRFSFQVVAGDIDVYDVVVNGGPKSNHYDYDDNVGATGAEPPGPVDAAGELHAPSKGNKLHNLSHINICYDVPGLTIIACDDPDPEPLTSEGLFTIAEATVFANSLHPDCADKRALFTIDNDAVPPTVTLEFQGNTGLNVAGRLDVTKEFGAPPFEDLTYDIDGTGVGPEDFVPVPWCDTRTFAPGDGTQFSEWLPTGTEDGLYPSLPAGHTACKVEENEDLSGTQLTVMYFELEDPQWR